VKVLIAADSTTHPREDDFCFTVAGELVWMPLACDCPDSGCERAVGGLASGKATTLFQVLDHPTMTRLEYLAALQDSLARQGWMDPNVGLTKHDVAEMADDLLAAADCFPAGTEMRRLGDRILERRRRRRHSTSADDARRAE